MTSYWCEFALLPSGEVAADVVVRTEGPSIAEVAVSQAAPPGALGLDGLTIPGLANCHSHVFHRALRGRTQRDRGSFWTWRDQMYQLADRLDPDSLRSLAVAVYREMAAAGFTSVGEFHYLHHQRGGTAYDDPNAMGMALIDAAREVGIRIALLDTCYLAGGVGVALDGVQLRFGDGSADGWRERAERLTADATSMDDAEVVVGAAVHSVRAVPAGDIPVVAEWAAAGERPLHAHLSEQVAENEACRAAYGRTPAEVLHEGGALGPRTSVVHATHLAPGDISLLGGARVSACFCPTTERDLGDGIGPATALREHGAGLTLGTDSHAIIDGFEEMRALELDERLATRRRGHWAAAELLGFGSVAGHASIGFATAGRIEAGADADLVTIDLDSPRTAGGGPRAETAVFAATSADVIQVVCRGRVVARREDHGAIGRELASVITAAWRDGA